MSERGERQKDVTEEFRAGYDRIFGSEHKPKRGRFKQDPETGEFISADEYDEKYSVSVSAAPYVISDMKEGVSPITGEVISSRSKMRDHCRAHNVYHVSPNDMKLKKGGKDEHS